jgi:hypothetical protein
MNHPSNRPADLAAQPGLVNASPYENPPLAIANAVRFPMLGVKNPVGMKHVERVRCVAKEMRRAMSRDEAKAMSRGRGAEASVSESNLRKRGRARKVFANQKMLGRGKTVRGRMLRASRDAR